MQSKFILGIALSLILSACIKAPQQTTIENQQLREQALVTPLENRVYQQITISDTEMNVEVVDTPQKIQTGLGYRDEIGADGMLFVFPRPHIASFWMKGMRFDLDFVWIRCEGEECRVVDLTENVPAPDDPSRNDLPTYNPKEEVNLILELPAGWVQKKEIKIGDSLDLNKVDTDTGW